MGEIMAEKTVKFQHYLKHIVANDTRNESNVSNASLVVIDCCSDWISPSMNKTQQKPI